MTELEPSAVEQLPRPMRNLAPHFALLGGTTAWAVLGALAQAPFNKTDLHLAIIDTNAACLVITGGRDPSPYVLDRAQHDATTILLAPHQTPETIAALSGVC